MKLTYEQIESMLGDAEKECVKLKAENAKLRELVRDAIPYVDCHIGLDECVHLHECHGNECVFEELARELGIEVDA